MFLHTNIQMVLKYFPVWHSSFPKSKSMWPDTTVAVPYRCLQMKPHQCTRYETISLLGRNSVKFWSIYYIFQQTLSCRGRVYNNTPPSVGERWSIAMRASVCLLAYLSYNVYIKLHQTLGACHMRRWNGDHPLAVLQDVMNAYCRSWITPY